MPGKFIKRALEPVVKRAAKQFPVVVLTGPRQSGKTTLLQHLFGASYRYVSLETPDVREAAISDPRTFLELNPPPVIFDEVQNVPELLSYVKERVDAKRGSSGQYLLSGSQNLLLMERITESLAGRAAIFRLLPLSQRELKGHPQAPLPWDSAPTASANRRSSRSAVWRDLLRGGYPELAAHPRREAALWYAGYVQTYLERDVRSIRQVGDLTQFQSFLRLLAARNAQLLRLSDLARDLGVAVNTAKAWLSVLESTYQIVILRPYFANVGKRLVKTPKVYFADVGMLCHLAGLTDVERTASGPTGGMVLETAVLSEIIRTLTHRGLDPQVYFWRTSGGVEVDFLVEAGDRVIPIEVKLSATPKPAMASGIRALRDDLGDRVGQGYVIHTGNTSLPLGSNTVALPFEAL